MLITEQYFQTLASVPQVFTNCMHSYDCTCNMHAVLHLHKKLCMVLIPLCKNNLNLPMCSFFFLPCASLPSPLDHCVVMLANSLCCAVFFVCLFLQSRFCSPAINQISHSQSKGWFPFILLCRWEKYNWTGLLGLHINYTNMISELYQHMYSYTSCKSHELWKMSSVLSNCYNWELLIANPHRPLCFKKIRKTTTTAFLISAQ